MRCGLDDLREPPEASDNKEIPLPKVIAVSSRLYRKMMLITWYRPIPIFWIAPFRSRALA